MPGHDLVVSQGGDLAPAERDDLDDAVDAFAASAKSDATRRAYRSDARDFIGWCARQGAEPVPAEPRVVARYLASLVARGLSVSTVDRRVAAITALHRSRGHDTPTAREDVRQVLDGIRRTHGRAPRKKRALTDDLVAKVVRKIPADTLAGLRDRAMILLCFAAALRRSELVALDVGDIEFHSRGLVVTVRRSKTDQQGKGKRKGVPAGKLKVPDAVRAWLDAARIVDGPVYQHAPDHLDTAGFVSTIAKEFGIKLDAGTRGKLDHLFHDKAVIGDAARFMPAVQDLLGDSLGGDDAKSKNKIAQKARAYRDASMQSIDTNGLMAAIMQGISKSPQLANAIFGSKQGGRIFAALGDPEFFKHTQATALECELRRYCPPHTVLVFDYSALS